VSGDTDGDHRGCCRRLLALSGRALAGDLAELLDCCSPRAFRKIRHQFIRAATCCAAADSFPDAAQYARTETWKVDPEYIHVSQDARARCADPRWHFHRAECHSCSIELYGHLEPPRSRNHPARGGLDEVIS